MNTNKVNSYIGFALKSRQIVIGVDNIKSTRKRIYLILADVNASDKNLEKLNVLCEEKNITMAKLKNNSLEKITGTESLQFIGICNSSLSNAIIKLQDEVEILKRGNL